MPLARAAVQSAAQLSQSQELSWDHPTDQQLCSTHSLLACDRSIAHVMGAPGHYQVQMVVL